MTTLMQYNYNTKEFSLYSAHGDKSSPLLSLTNIDPEEMRKIDRAFRLAEKRALEAGYLSIINDIEARLKLLASML